jgi:pyridoxal 5'-phosphate synthase pdxS subunit
VPYELVTWVAEHQQAAGAELQPPGGVATPADAVADDAARRRDGVRRQGIFKSSNPPLFAKSIVQAVTHYEDPMALIEASRKLGDAMPGLEISEIPQEERLAGRGV